MSTDRDVTRIVRSWLEEGATSLPDRVLDERARPAPSDPTAPCLVAGVEVEEMNAYTKFAVAAAAVAVVAVIGISLLPRQGGIGGPVATPTAGLAHPVADRAPVLRVTRAWNVFDRRSEHHTSDALHLHGTTGWATAEGFLTKEKDQPGEVMLSTWVVTHVYADSCHHTPIR